VQYLVVYQFRDDNTKVFGMGNIYMTVTPDIYNKEAIDATRTHIADVLRESGVLSPHVVITNIIELHP